MGQVIQLILNVYEHEQDEKYLCHHSLKKKEYKEGKKAIETHSYKKESRPTHTLPIL